MQNNKNNIKFATYISKPGLQVSPADFDKPTSVVTFQIPVNNVNLKGKIDVYTRTIISP